MRVLVGPLKPEGYWEFETAEDWREETTLAKGRAMLLFPYFQYAPFQSPGWPTPISIVITMSYFPGDYIYP